MPSSCTSHRCSQPRLWRACVPLAGVLSETKWPTAWLRLRGLCASSACHQALQTSGAPRRTSLLLERRFLVGLPPDQPDVWSRFPVALPVRRACGHQPPGGLVACSFAGAWVPWTPRPPGRALSARITPPRQRASGPRPACVGAEGCSSTERRRQRCTRARWDAEASPWLTTLRTMCRQPVGWRQRAACCQPRGGDKGPGAASGVGSAVDREPRSSGGEGEAGPIQLLRAHTEKNS